SFGAKATLAEAGLPVPATGTVKFYTAANALLCTVTLSATSCTTSTSLARGIYPGIHATYSGDATYSTSNSTSTVSLTVERVTPTVACSNLSGSTSTILRLA